jgi:SEC-C motif-containing protein
MSTIPFGDSKALEAHCLPFIRGQKQPATAAELMAARYVAYTLAEVDYILDTHNPAAKEETDRDATLKWAKEATWQSLELVNTEGGGETDRDGMVEFIARYAMDGKDVAHHERASFRRIDGRWYFIDAKQVLAPVRREGPKLGRNDPCHCGSGKKLKKCHGTASIAAK